MSTALDSNILVAFWDEDDALNSLAASAMRAALALGNLIISAPVYAELLAFRGRTEDFLDPFLADTAIAVDWIVDEQVWRIAGGAFQTYAARRRKQREQGPRRILTDFLIGAHALRGGHRLLTLDDRHYRAAFPHLEVIAL